MTWEEKFEAIKALSSEASLMMREPGNWYVSAPRVDVGGDGFLRGAYGNGSTPQAAVEDHWTQWSTVEYPLYLDVQTTSPRKVRWNKYMWKDVAP